jgi:hypothetical protein
MLEEDCVGHMTYEVLILVMICAFTFLVGIFCAATYKGVTWMLDYPAA